MHNNILPDVYCIYKLYYKDDPTFFYVGKASNLRTRINSHKNSLSKYPDQKLYRFIYSKGWDNFQVEIVQELNIKQHKLQEHNIEQEYLDILKPTLNTNKSKIYSKKKNNNSNYHACNYDITTQCKLCPRRFTKSKTYKTHMRKEHNIIIN